MDHIPPVNFITVTMGSAAILLIGWRTLLFSILPDDQKKKNDVYKRDSPFELFEVMVFSCNYRLISTKWALHFCVHVRFSLYACSSFCWDLVLVGYPK